MPATISLVCCFCLLCLLAAANGANDVSRAAATLLAGGVTTYRKALWWTISFTLAGSLFSYLIAFGVAKRFAAFLASGSNQPSVSAICSVILGAALWIVFATSKRIPVATTHAILGSLLGVSWLQFGFNASARLNLWKNFALPLLTSPLIALTGAWLLARVVRRIDVKPGFFDRPHWVSCALVAFSRGVNDSAKIWALVLPIAFFSPLLARPISGSAVTLVAIAMFLGGLLSGRRVTRTLAFRVTEMGQSFSAVANITTAAIILTASFLSFPVASSHVIAGAILGVGLAKNAKAVYWSTMTEMSSAWILTLPASAFLSIGIFSLLQLVHPSFPATYVPLTLSMAALGAIWLLLKQSSVKQRLIVFVCTSNTSRSAMAEMICRALLAATDQETIRGGADNTRIVSRGLSSIQGKPMTPLAAQTLLTLGIKPRRHRSKLLTNDLVHRAEAIFCMTQKQVMQAAELFPAAADRIHRLIDEDDIPDPSTGGATEYAAVAGLIQSGVINRLAWLQLEGSTHVAT